MFDCFSKQMSSFPLVSIFFPSRRQLPASSSFISCSAPPCSLRSSISSSLTGLEVPMPLIVSFVRLRLFYRFRNSRRSSGNPLCRKRGSSACSPIWPCSRLNLSPVSTESAAKSVSPKQNCAVALLPNVIRAALFVSMSLNQAVLPLISPRIHAYPFLSCFTHYIDRHDFFLQDGFSAIEQGAVPVGQFVEFVCETRALCSASAGRVSCYFEEEYCSPASLLSVYQVRCLNLSIFSHYFYC